MALSKKTITWVLGTFTSVVAAITIAWPAVIGDYPPLAGRERVATQKQDIKDYVKMIGNSIQAELVAGRIFNLRKEECQAREQRNLALADTLSDQVENLRTQYEMLTQGRYVLRDCIEFQFRR